MLQRAFSPCLHAALVALCVFAPQQNTDAVGAVRFCIAPSGIKKRMPQLHPRLDDKRSSGSSACRDMKRV